jgi:hypothetical protein
VKQCITPPASRALLAHDRDRVIGRRPRVDDQRAGGLARRPDMRAKARALPFEVPAAAEIIESRLADGNDLALMRTRHEQIDAGLAGGLVVRMHTDARVEIGVLERKRVHCRPRVHLDADAQRVRDAVLAHRVEHLRQVVAQFREIEVTVRIDEHCQGSGIRHQGSAKRRGNLRRKRLRTTDT